MSHTHSLQGSDRNCEVRFRDDEARALFAAQGVPVNPLWFASSPVVAGEIAATRISGDVALKIVATEVTHKSSAGGVRLNVPPKEVAVVAQKMFAQFKEREIQVQGVTVEPMVISELELFIGGVTDSAYGPMLSVGSGGVDLEIRDDLAFGLVPLQSGDAERMLRSTVIGRILARRFKHHFQTVVDLINNLGGSDGVLINSDVTQFDLNPIAVSQSGIAAVDVRASQSSRKVYPGSPRDRREVYSELAPAIYPRSIAVVGASNDPSKLGYWAVRHLVDFGFEGHLNVVNPRADEICGIKAMPSVHSLPAKIDRAIVAVPGAMVPTVLDQLSARGAKTAHVYSVVESDTALPATNGMRVLGPNSLGVYSPRLGLTMVGSRYSPVEEGDVAFISQSGTFAGEMVRRGGEAGLRFSFVASVGNCDDVSATDMLAFCAEDENTKVIVFHLESDRDAGAFFRAARGIDKPIILMKTARSQLGSEVAQTHTGAVSTAPRALESIAEGAHVLLLDTLDSVIDLLMLYRRTPQIEGEGIGIFGSGGGVAVAAADQTEAYGMTLPPLDHETRSRITNATGVDLEGANPVELPVWALHSGNDVFTGDVVTALGVDPQIEAVCAYLGVATLFDMLPEGEATELSSSMIGSIFDAYDKNDKPLAFVLRCGDRGAQGELLRRTRQLGARRNIPVVPSMERAVVAIAGLRTLTRWERG